MLTKIISGGQTGADQGGLDAALYLGIEVGGWITKGRRIEGMKCVMPIEQFRRYKLVEHRSRSYIGRTLDNVKDSDGTVVFGNVESSGSYATINICKYLRKPFILNPDEKELILWIAGNRIKCLNVAGNRESVNPGIHDRVFSIIVAALQLKSPATDELRDE